MLTRTLLRTGFRDLRRRPLPTALMVLGVAGGAAVGVAHNLAIPHPPPRLLVRPGPFRAGDRSARLPVLPLLPPGAAASPQPPTGLILMDVGAAQKLPGQEGRLSHIALRATPAEAERPLALLPPGVRLAPAH